MPTNGECTDDRDTGSRGVSRSQLDCRNPMFGSPDPLLWTSPKRVFQITGKSATIYKHVHGIRP